MLNLDVYSGRDLQQFLSMLNQCEDVGVTDIRFIREKIQNHILKGLLGHKIKVNAVKRNARKENLVCPSCGKKTFKPTINSDGLTIFGCSECRYSSIMNHIRKIIK